MPRVAPVVSLNSAVKAALDLLMRSPSTPQGLVQRSRIVLAAAAGKTNQQSTTDDRTVIVPRLRCRWVPG